MEGAAMDNRWIVWGVLHCNCSLNFLFGGFGFVSSFSFFLSLRGDRSDGVKWDGVCVCICG